MMKQLTPRHPLVLALTALAVVAGGAGCGGSSGSDAPTLSTSSLTEAEFADRVEAICARGRSEALRYQPARAGESQRDALTAVIERTLLPSIEKVVEDVYALGAPPGEKGQTEAMLVAMREALSKSEDLELPTIERIEDLFAPAGRLARRAGLANCIYGDD